MDPHEEALLKLAEENYRIANIVQDALEFMDDTTKSIILHGKEAPMTFERTLTYLPKLQLPFLDAYVKPRLLEVVLRSKATLSDHIGAVGRLRAKDSAEARYEIQRREESYSTLAPRIERGLQLLGRIEVLRAELQQNGKA